METTTHNDQATLTQARKQYAMTQASKAAHALKKGTTRFMDQNGRVVGAVALGAVVLIATVRVARTPRSSPRLLPRLSNGLSARKTPVRRAVRAVRKRAGGGMTVSTGAALTGAAALIGTGLTLLLAPRLFTRARS